MGGAAQKDGFGPKKSSEWNYKDQVLEARDFHHGCMGNLPKWRRSWKDGDCFQCTLVHGPMGTLFQLVSEWKQARLALSIPSSQYFPHNKFVFAEKK
jgi:hypothetical protein